MLILRGLNGHTNSSHCFGHTAGFMQICRRKSEEVGRWIVFGRKKINWKMKMNHTRFERVAGTYLPAPDCL